MTDNRKLSAADNSFPTGKVIVADASAAPSFHTPGKIVRPPAFQFYPDDFLGGTCDMTQEEVGAYILLLCYQWNHGSAPVQPDRQKLVARGNVSEHVLAKFETCPDGQLRNARLEVERQKQAEYREKQRLKGLASGKAREQRFNRGSTVVQPSGEPQPQPEGNSPSPSTSTKTSRKREKTVLTLEPDIPPHETNPDHTTLIKLWSEAFQTKFGTPYTFNGGRDGKAVKELLLAGWKPEKVVEIARRAWLLPNGSGAPERCWNCFNRSKTLHDFQDACNKIVSELDTESKRRCF